MSEYIHIDFFSAGNGCINEDDFPNVVIHNHGWVSHSELEEALERADILLSIAEKDGKQISSKIFEYMSFGKPILHFYYSNTDVNRRYLSKYPLAMCVNHNETNSQKQENVFRWMLSVKNLRVPMNIVETLFKEMTPKYIVDNII